MAREDEKNYRKSHTHLHRKCEKCKSSAVIKEGIRPLTKSMIFEKNIKTSN
jgi:hypothetical protein